MHGQLFSGELHEAWLLPRGELDVTVRGGVHRRLLERLPVSRPGEVLSERLRHHLHAADRPGRSGRSVLDKEVRSVELEHGELIRAFLHFRHTADSGKHRDPTREEQSRDALLAGRTADWKRRFEARRRGPERPLSRRGETRAGT